MAPRTKRPPLNDLDVRAWMRFTKSWYVCNPPPRRRAELEHPAKFPEAMAQEFIRFFTRAGEVVLDPFCGVGSALVAAEACDRVGVGVELLPEFAARARAYGEPRASRRVLQGDARQAVDLCRAAGVEEVHYVLTSPPYWDMLRHTRGNVRSAQKERQARGLRTTYSEDAQDLGNITDYDGYLDALTAILADLRRLLAPGRYLTVVAQNVRVRSGEVRPLAWDLAARLSRVYTFKGERLWLQDNKRLGCWGWPAEFVTNVHHHYCLNFKHDRGG
ncbi:MAG: class I SAM-dependent methyltransferase [Armatimonadetes bacterium]|nr:class I SAM-dependent methyltransferase [Armatimonadota bacterium]